MALEPDAAARSVGRLVAARARWLAAGMDRDDLARLESAAATGVSPARALRALASLYERAAEAAAEAGHGLSQVAYGRRAALAHAMRATVSSRSSAGARRSAAALYAAVAPRLTPPARPVRLTVGERPVAGYLRTPGAAAPLVLLLAEARAGAEATGRLEDRLLARGLATLTGVVDGAMAGAWPTLHRQARALCDTGCPGIGVWATDAALVDLALEAAGEPDAARAVVMADAPLLGGAGARRREALARARAPMTVLATDRAGDDDRSGRRRGLLAAVADLDPAPGEAKPTGLSAYDEHALDTVADWLSDRLREGRR